MTVYTKQWRAEQAKVKSARSKLASASKKNGSILSEKANLKAKINANQKEIDGLKEGVNYYRKKKSDKKLTKRKTPKPLTAAQKKRISTLQTQIDKANTKLNSSDFKSKASNASSKVSNAQKKLSSAKSERDKYESKRHKTALKRIAAQRKQNAKQFLAPHASLHATNSMTGLEVFIFASSESESNESEATTYPIDHDDPVVDHVRRTGKTITVTGWLFDQKAGDRLWSGNRDDVSGAGLVAKTVQKQFQNLRKWQFDGTELVYKSDWVKPGFNHIYYKHLFMTGLEKTLDAPYKGMIQITMTFQFAYKARVVTKKKTKKNSGKKSKSGTKKKSKKKTIAVKYGMTYWGLAKTYHTTVTQLRKWNGSEKKTMYPDPKTGKYPKRLRVK